MTHREIALAALCGWLWIAGGWGICRIPEDFRAKTRGWVILYLIYWPILATAAFFVKTLCGLIDWLATSPRD